MLMGTDPLRELGSTVAAPIDRSDENGGSPANPTASCGDLTAAPHGSTPRALPGRHAPTSGRPGGVGSSRSPCAVGRKVGRDRAQTSRAALRREGTSARMGSCPDP
jgi:hypothetical protein